MVPALSLCGPGSCPELRARQLPTCATMPFADFASLRQGSDLRRGDRGAFLQELLCSPIVFPQTGERRPSAAVLVSTMLHGLSERSR